MKLYTSYLRYDCETINIATIILRSSVLLAAYKAAGSRRVPSANIIHVIITIQYAQYCTYCSSGTVTLAEPLVFYLVGQVQFDSSTIY